tara:strand:- start:1101 stop:1601 length:501 start_codon:yes stop_codon:yes gene_type:complete
VERDNTGNTLLVTRGTYDTGDFRVDKLRNGDYHYDANDVANMMDIDRRIARKNYSEGGSTSVWYKNEDFVLPDCGTARMDQNGLCVDQERFCGLARIEGEDDEQVYEEKCWSVIESGDNAYRTVNSECDPDLIYATKKTDFHSDRWTHSWEWDSDGNGHCEFKPAQ